MFVKITRFKQVCQLLLSLIVDCNTAVFFFFHDRKILRIALASHARRHARKVREPHTPRVRREKTVLNTYPLDSD